MDPVLAGILAVPFYFAVEVRDRKSSGKLQAAVALYAPDDFVGRGLRFGPPQ